MTAIQNASQTLLQELDRAGRLPTPPGVALQIVQLCRSENSTLRDLTRVINGDASLTARLLKYANSPMSGIGRKVASAAEAVQCLGFGTVQVIALGFALPIGGKICRCKRFNLKEFWTLSFVSALIAKQLARCVEPKRAEEIFTAALLANFGRLALAHSMPDAYNLVLDSVGRNRTLIEAERANLKVDHETFGADLLASWGLPDKLVEVVRYRSRPKEAPSQIARWSQTLGLAAELAPAFVNGGVGGGVGPQGADGLRRKIDEQGIDAESWNDISAKVVEEYRQLKAILEVEIDDQLGAMNLFADAHREATRLAMEQQIETSRLAREQGELLRRASTDTVTQIANRAKFDERLLDAVKRIHRGKTDIALLFVDIDHFKHINDTYGHGMGDQALRAIATLLTTAVRDTDFVARYGGDEFGVLLFDAKPEQVLDIAQRIVTSVAKSPLTFNSVVLPLTVSVGIALGAEFAPAPDADQIKAVADQQLYASKTSGRNMWSSRRGCGRPASAPLAARG